MALSGTEATTLVDIEVGGGAFVGVNWDFHCFLVLNSDFSQNWLSSLRSIKRTCITRVWKGILGIRDLTKIRCGIRENAKDLAGIRDLTATREAGFPKIWARDAGFCCLSVGNSGNRHDPNKRYSGKPGELKISIERANLRLKFISFCRN